MQVRHAEVLQVGRRRAARVQGEARRPAQPARQPGQVAVAAQGVLGQAQRAQARQPGERLGAQPRQVVVVERPGQSGVVAAYVSQTARTK